MFPFYMIFFNVFVFQFCDVIKVVIIHKSIYPKLTTKNMKGNSFNICVSIYIYIYIYIYMATHLNHVYKYDDYQFTKFHIITHY
jgi:hypothetical protein